MILDDPKRRPVLRCRPKLVKGRQQLIDRHASGEHDRDILRVAAPAYVVGHRPVFHHVFAAVSCDEGGTRTAESVLRFTLPAVPGGCRREGRTTFCTTSVMTERLAGSVGLVCGGSRGVGRGCALGLGEAGMSVWITGRTETDGAGPVPLAGSVTSTAEAVSGLGGRGVARACDHIDDASVERVFADLLSEEGRLDVLVNAVWGGYERFVGLGELSFGPFWEQPLALWDSMHARGVRASYVSSCLAARAMVERGHGLIVCISSFAAQTYIPPVAYGVAHAAIDRMVADMAREIRESNVTIVSLYPGLVRSENVLANKEYFDLSGSESPQFIGRAVAALAADPDVIRHAGRSLVAAELAAEYGFADTDGTTPRSLRAQILGP